MVNDVTTLENRRLGEGRGRVNIQKLQSHGRELYTYFGSSSYCFIITNVESIIDDAMSLVPSRLGGGKVQKIHEMKREVLKFELSTFYRYCFIKKP